MESESETPLKNPYLNTAWVNENETEKARELDR